MGQDIINDAFENYRIRFQLSHERLKEMASYIRLTDGAIWGFLGISFLEIFKEASGNLFSKIALFSIIVIIAMYLWRTTVATYQTSIEEEYLALRYYEKMLKFEDHHSLTARQNEKRENWVDSKYVDRNHLRLDTIASVIIGLAVLYLIPWALASFANLKICSYSL